MLIPLRSPSDQLQIVLEFVQFVFVAHRAGCQQEPWGVFSRGNDDPEAASVVKPNAPLGLRFIWPDSC